MDYNERAAKGQAYNLAVQWAIATMETQMKYSDVDQKLVKKKPVFPTDKILEAYLYFYKLGATIQESSVEELAEFLREQKNAG